MEDNKNISAEAAKLVLGGKKEGFFYHVILWNIIKIKLVIPYLSTADVTKVSGHSAGLKKLDADKDMFREMLSKADNYKYLIAIVASSTYPKIPFLKWVLRKSTTNKTLLKLLEIVKHYSDPESFFLSTNLGLELNKLQPRENLEEG